ncbi:hypothetical protein TruAng_008417 [Truncatella angustata]|nr:hypothetical protein TruAng_008417 [Truncatella angustata]
MRCNIGAAVLAAIAPLGALAADSVVTTDPETGFTFSSYAASYAIGKTLTIRVAIPSNATPNAPYDAVVQLAAPVEVGWTGLAWGGSMVQNPLTIGWANGNSAIITPRWATGHSTPAVYSGATLQVLKIGTHTNGASGAKVLSPTGSNRLAFAYSKSKPSNPSSGSSSFPVHDVTNYWSHDFAAAQNVNFAALVAKNS